MYFKKILNLILLSHVLLTISSASHRASEWEADEKAWEYIQEAQRLPHRQPSSRANANAAVEQYMKAVSIQNVSSSTLQSILSGLQMLANPSKESFEMAPLRCSYPLDYELGVVLDLLINHPDTSDYLKNTYRALLSGVQQRMNQNMRKNYLFSRDF